MPLSVNVVFNIAMTSQIADASHVPMEEETLRNIIAEEKGKESFTVVMIQGINPDHLPYLKVRFKDWTRQLR